MGMMTRKRGYEGDRRKFRDRRKGGSFSLTVVVLVQSWISRVFNGPD